MGGFFLKSCKTLPGKWGTGIIVILALCMVFWMNMKLNGSGGKLLEIQGGEAQQNSRVQATEKIMGEGAENSFLLTAPAVSAKTAVVIELSSGRVLYEKNKDKKAYPASITKIMTALLAVEQGELEKQVKVSDRARGVEGSSIYLEKEESLILRDLLYGLILRSGNDAACAIAEEIGRTEEGFVAQMNERAQEIGAKNTHFMNPSGLHHPNHYTTAEDMALIARKAMQNPAFSVVAGAKSWQAHRGEGGYNLFYNKNKVIFDYEGGTGVKIGYTKAAGRTLVASAKRGNMEVICVVMEAPDWFSDSYALMNYAFDHYEQARLALGQSALKTVKVEGGEKAYTLVGPKEDVLCPVWKGTAADISIQYIMGRQCQAPVARWQEAGLLNIYVKEEHLYSVPLYFLEDISARRHKSGS